MASEQYQKASDGRAQINPTRRLMGLAAACNKRIVPRWLMRPSPR